MGEIPLPSWLRILGPSPKGRSGSPAGYGFDSHGDLNSKHVPRWMKMCSLMNLNPCWRHLLRFIDSYSLKVLTGKCSIVFSQRNVTVEVKLAAYKGKAPVLDRSSNASMDFLEGFSPVDTTGFIAIQAIRLKKFGQQKIIGGEPLY
ncbi:hypothetical protein LI328DRAFT_162664 [Trichoderma asperelloides]|nr:hypothetical protein LI328DRAFT_162664 [Trichoderma asperelloides]